MKDYLTVHLLDLANEIGEDNVLRMLGDFSCEINPEVDDFLHNNAMDFAKKRLASTYLVFARKENELVLVGYFSLTHKYFQANETELRAVSNTLKKRIDKFMPYDSEIGCRMFSAPLIGQLGKNFNNGYDSSISGAELLNIACATVDNALKIIGGKIVCLECENKGKLVEFYKANGFNSFSRRLLERSEKDKMSGDYLLQMLKYL
ncbi:MAG: N-acetyltransferase [Selenomonadaceae bacterium]|nr:N-acetyltransferase [Selenomonadaceae bacterium]